MRKKTRSGEWATVVFRNPEKKVELEKDMGKACLERLGKQEKRGRRRQFNSVGRVHYCPVLRGRRQFHRIGLRGTTKEGLKAAALTVGCHSSHLEALKHPFAQAAPQTEFPGVGVKHWSL